MTTLHLVNLQGHGGMETLFAKFFSTVSATGSDDFLVTKGSISKSLELGHPVKQSASNIKRFHHIPIPNALHLRHHNFVRIIKKIKPANIVFWSTLPSIPTLEFCRKKNIRTIYYDHGKIWRLPELHTRDHLSHIDKVLTVSHAAAQVFRLRIGFVGHLEIIPNPSRVASTNSERRELRPKPSPLQIGFAARMVSIKGFPIALETFAKLKERGLDVYLNVAGDGPNLEKWKKVASQRLGDTGKISFLGSVSEMERFYDKQDIMIIPSLNDSFGLVSAEASARGAVPLVSNVDGLPETVVDQLTGYIIPLDQSLEYYTSLGGDTHDFPENVYNPKTDSLIAPQAPNAESFCHVIEKLHNDRDLLLKVQRNAISHADDAFSFRQYLASFKRSLHY